MVALKKQGETQSKDTGNKNYKKENQNLLGFVFFQLWSLLAPVATRNWMAAGAFLQQQSS